MISPFYLLPFFVLPLFFIAYQDFKQRQVSWYWFLALFTVCVAAVALSEQGFLWLRIVVNLSVLLVFASTVLVYVLIKRKKLKGVNQFVGFGDLLFSICISLLFAPMLFIYFHMVSFIIGIALFISFRALKSQNFQTIPLAGIQAAMLIVLLIYDIAFKQALLTFI